MSKSINKVILVGNLGVDPELRTTQSGVPVCTFSLATNETWTGQDGEKQEKVEWHRIVVWRKLAEICNEYLHKGSKVYLEGKLQTRSWDDQDGQKRYMTEVVVSEMVMLGEGGGTGRPGPGDEDAPPPSRNDSQDMLPNGRDGSDGKPGANDDLPF